MPPKYDYTRVEVTQQGAVRVSDGKQPDQALIYRQAEGIVCLYLDLSSKRAEADIWSHEEFPCIALMASEGTLFLDEAYQRDDYTIVVFPDYPGWRVWVAQRNERYEVSIVLLAPEPKE